MTREEELKREIYHLGIAREQILLSYNRDNEEKMKEIEKLRAELARIHSKGMNPLTIPSVEYEKAINLLKKLEWSATARTGGGYTTQACPFCKGSYRHGSNCELDKMANPSK